jgi:hypothetical protein
MLWIAPLSLLVALAQGGPAGVGSSVAELAETETTKQFVIHYRAGSKAGAAVDRIAWHAEAEYRRIVETLELQGKIDETSPFFLFLYDDVDDIHRVTGTSGHAGFSTARESHVPFDNDQTRLHELVHIVMAAVKDTGPEPRNMFFVEGIANAVLRFVHGIPVHAVAAYERRRGTLPPIATLASGDFYGYLQANPGFNGYDVGASYMLFLLDTHGAKKTVDYYKGKPAAKAFGTSLERLEASWLAFLDSFEMRPELLALLQERRGDVTPPGSDDAALPSLTPELLGDPAEWLPFAGDLQTTGSFRREAEAILGRCESGSDWDLCSASDRQYRECMVRATIETLGDCYGVQLRLGSQFSAMVLGMGSFLYFQDHGGVAFTDLEKLRADRKIDLLLIVRDGHQEVWIDGRKRLEAKLPAVEGALGVGVVGGSAKFSDLRVRPL